ncbi:MAG: FlgD immunoglobulin-like domain containing protein, partial [Rectinemataceae bacterium]
GSPEGYSSAASLGFSIPAPAGVWSGAIRFFSADSAMHTMPLGTFGLVGGGFSKRLSSRLTIGTSLWAGIGSNGTLGWGAWMDLGIIQELGSIEQPRGSTAERIGFLSDIRMGLAVRGIGREFNYASQYDPVTDSLLPGIATGFPPRFTPALGFSALLVNLPWLSINAALDLAAPSFADVEGGVGLGFSFWNALFLRTYWSTSLHDLVAGTGRSLLPSAALSGRIRLGGSNVGKGSLSAVETAAGFQPLYKSLQAVGGGVDLTFGGRDRTPPEVKAVLPAPLHGIYSFSPNADGSKDWLEIPITVRDTQGFVAGWEFRIEDPSRGDGKRVIYSTGRQLIPDRIRSLGDLFRSLARVDKDVFIPDVLRWDGRDNNGTFVPEGTYLASFYAWDNAGNKNTDLDGCLKIVVDRQPPAANTWVAGTDETYVPTDSLILSPDGDGNKDVIAFRTQGSIENAWKYEIIDRSGKAVRTVEIKEQAAPRDFVWDGTDDQGKVVPDGRYRFRLSAADESGNIGSRVVGNSPDESDWIIVDTSRPRIFLQSAVTAFSPNGDGELDVQSIDLNLESTRNLLSWELSILDQNKKQVWVRRGPGDNPPQASYSFDGRDDTGQMLPDGWYEAVVRLRYRNGYTPVVASSPFLLDVIPPSATIVLDDERAIFSPDGDGSRDTLGFRLSGTREDVWKLSIVSADGRTVLEKSYIEELADRFVWDGKDASGKLVEDGRYTLLLACVDGAGNAFRTEYKPIMVDTSRPQARLALNREAFSPNDDGVADVIELRVDLDMKGGIRQWRLDLSDATGRAIGSLGAGGTGSVPPSLLKLDGMLGATRLAEGKYRCTLELEYDNGWKTRAASPEFILDITPPNAEVLASREVFNPKGAP